MVPELLSSNLCSLRSNVERYVLIEYAVQISTIDTVIDEIKIKKSFIDDLKEETTFSGNILDFLV
jgi:exoribonuclease R